MCVCDESKGYFSTADNQTCSYDPDNASSLAGLTPYYRKPNQTKSPRSYVASLRLTNKANLSSSTWSRPFILDLDPPVFRGVSFSYQGAPIDFLRNSSLEAQWSFESNISQMAYYVFRVGSTPALADLVPATRTLSSNVSFRIPTPRAPLSQVYFSVTGYSGAMLNATQTIPMTFLTGPPDTSRAAVSYSQLGRFLAWQGFEDVSSYYIGIGTSKFGANIMNWTLTATGNTSAGPFLAGLCDGPNCGTGFLPTDMPSIATPVWLSIRANNRAGFWSAPVSPSFATVLLGSDAAVLQGSILTSKTWGFDDSSAVATISSQLRMNSTNGVALLPVGPYQYDVAQNTSVKLSRPNRLLVLRAGSMYAEYANVSVNIVSLQASGIINKDFGTPGINASIALDYMRTDGVPAIFYNGFMNNSYYTPVAWQAQPTDFDIKTQSLSWKPTAPGLHHFYYNRTFPSFCDLNSDGLADVLHVVHSTVTEKVNFGWGILEASITGPVARRNYVANISPKFAAFTGFGPAITNNDFIAAVGDFDADGALDYVMSKAGYPLFSPWSSASYAIYFNKSSTPMAVASPKTGIYPTYYDTHTLIGFADVDGDTFLDSIWYSTGLWSINYSPGITICTAKGGNYANGCTFPFYVSFRPFFGIVGVGSWTSNTTGILTFRRDNDGTLSFSIVNLLVARTVAGAVTSVSTFAPIAVSMTAVAQSWQTWSAHVPGDLNADGVSDLILQCTSYIGLCGPSRNLYSYTIAWHLNAVGKVISTRVMDTPVGSRLALGTLIYR
ncbi:hypothetical protein HDU86_007630 [Geranomyces michiganensis]|nr:hypothetical protein HDU86_007630 [Geranomyces michiganensis]